MTLPKNYLFALIDGGGAGPPLLTAAAKLLKRGHRVRVLSDPTHEAEVTALGAAFVPWRRAPHRTSRSREHDPLRDWEAATPQEGVKRVIDAYLCGPALAYAQDLGAELEREPADLVVSHDMLFGVFAGCESRGQALAILSPNINMFPMPGVPPFGPGLTPARNDEERALHAHIAAATAALFDSGLPALNAARAALGLAPLAQVFEQAGYAKVHLLATSRAFDFPAERLPANVRYVGPQLADPLWVETWSSPWPADDARPLVLVSFSTTFQNHTAVLQRVIEALAELPVRALVTLGGVVEPEELRAAGNTVLVPSAPHHAVMREAALVVTHGGHGTVMAALSHRLPLLLIPHGRDQNDNAARVSDRGAGLSLPATNTVEALREAILRLLREPHFKAQARRLGDAVAAEGERSTIVAELEAAVGE